MKMKYGLMMVLLLGMFTVPMQAAEIVVLTEEPVPVFTFPDGSVVSNAYAFHPTSQGLMVIHDGGSRYLNFSMFPDDWRAAYAVSDDVEQSSVVMSSGKDPYEIDFIIDKVEGLKNVRRAFYKSSNYKGDDDEALLAACALQCMLDKNWDEAARLEKLLRKEFPKTKFTALKTYIITCEACQGKGVRVSTCTECKGSGSCPYCAGTGKVESMFELNAPEAQRCVSCQGTGSCLKCNGQGTVSSACVHCQGRGKLADKELVEKALAVYVKKLNTP
ncbi:MAG: hypothetical protein JXR40_05965 [Pontiellaceae bacterium]|nr:hypothetical protein [Pontiellaceae bacterium]